MASVTFMLVAPDQEGLVALHVWEGPTAEGPFSEIDVLTDVGAYPTYVDSHTTESALSASDWFAVTWESADGAFSDLSAPIQGGTSTLVSVIISRVRQRDNSLTEDVVRQEAEAAIEQYIGNDVDPYSVPFNLPYRIVNGLVYLTMARAYVFSRAIGNTQSVTIGVVSLRQGSTSNTVTTNVDKLLELANRELGLNVSRVMQLAPYRRRCLAAVVTEP